MTDTQPLAPTDAELTAIYKAANGEDTGKAQPLTTQRIFRAMRAVLAKWGAQPVACEPLTDEHLRVIERMHVYAHTATLMDFARAIERAHGITPNGRKDGS